jgi:hypothetical protein
LRSAYWHAADGYTFVRVCAGFGAVAAFSIADAEETNADGLTFEEWTNAAGTANETAWRAGEDPTEYRV